MHQVPIELAARISNRLGISHAVESGTYLGDSCRKLASVFDEVWTIELSEDLHRKVKESLGHLEHVHFIQGSSERVLPSVLSEVAGPALFWLDGHWTADSGLSPTAGRESQCPVIDEIAAINAWPWASSSCVLIDDARLFLGPPPPPYRRQDWPQFLEVVDQLRAIAPRFVTVLDDFIISGPPHLSEVVDEYWFEVLARGEDPTTTFNNALNPPPRLAAKRLAVAVVPDWVVSLYRKLRKK